MDVDDAAAAAATARNWDAIADVAGDEFVEGDKCELIEDKNSGYFGTILSKINFDIAHSTFVLRLIFDCYVYFGVCNVSSGN